MTIEEYDRRKNEILNCRRISDQDERNLLADCGIIPREDGAYSHPNLKDRAFATARDIVVALEHQVRKAPPVCGISLTFTGQTNDRIVLAAKRRNITPAEFMMLCVNVQLDFMEDDL